MKTKLLDKNGLTEEEYLANYKPRSYPGPAVTADVLVFAGDPEKNGGFPAELLMIRRGGHPFLNQWALPGGFVNPEETADAAACRELKEETGVLGVVPEQLAVFSRPDRDPRMRVISCAYTARIPKAKPAVKAGDDAAGAQWFSVSWEKGPEKNVRKLTLSCGGIRLSAVFRTAETETDFGIVRRVEESRSEGLAFDHAEIIAAALLKYENEKKVLPESKKACPGDGASRPETGSTAGKRRAAASAVIAGDVVLEAGVNIWYGAVVRGDVSRIVIGRNSNVQDNCVLHGSAGFDIRIGENVTIGHAAVVHGCTIGDDVLIGMQAAVLDGAVIGRGSIIGAGALVTEGKIIPPGSLVVGVPGKVIRTVLPEQIEMTRENAAEYLRLSESLPEWPGPPEDGA